MSDNNIQLKKAKKKDFSKIAQIYSDSFSEYPYNEPWTLKKAIKKIKIFNKYCDIWKILYKEDLAGFIIVNPNQFLPGTIAFGEEIAIKKELRGNGIGKNALRKIIEIYNKKGFEIFMGIANNNSKAFKLWKKLGIKESKENILMEKQLNNKNNRE